MTAAVKALAAATAAGLLVLLVVASREAPSPLSPLPSVDPAMYGWTRQYDSASSIAKRIPAPPGYERVDVAEGSFAWWLRHLPLEPGRPEVRLFSGGLKRDQTAHHAVIDIDVGDRNLQQCADVVIRFRAEYLFAAGRAGEIHFDFTSGDRADFVRWSEGFRPVVRGNEVTWRRSAEPDGTRSSLRRYLDTVFNYAGTASLSRELTQVAEPGDVRIGDVFIQGGFPGHAVIVVDLAASVRTGRRAFLLAQGYMPAQEPHVLVNPNGGLSPWYDAEAGPPLRTPEWAFPPGSLRRFER